jgi:hypothetical protein
MCALDESVVDRRSLLRAGDEPALQHPEQRRFLADLQRRQCLAGRLQPVRSLSRGLNGGVVDKFEKRFVLCRRFVRRFLRRADRDALENEWRAPERLGLGISVSRDFRATRKSDAVFRRHHDAERRAAIQLRADAMTGLSSTQRFKKGSAGNRARGVARSADHFLGASLAVALFLGADAFSAPYASPNDWLPATFTDFAVETADNAPYFDVWRPEIGRNNEAARARGILIAPGLQAPLAESHWSIRSDPTTAAVTIVNFDCDPTPVYAGAEVAVLKCPARTILWTGPLRTVKNQPKSCFVQFRSASAPAAGPASFAAANSGVFMSYDVASSSIKIGVILDHKVFDACSAYLRLKD